MTAGSAVVSRDSPPVFGNLLAYRDEIVPWLRRLADNVHEHGAAVMIQLTHLGRRTVWNKADWLPVLAASPLREAAHRALPKAMEDWDFTRIASDYAAAAQRMKEAGLDGIELEAYGHLLDGFWSPATNERADAHNGSLENRLRFTFSVLRAVRASVGCDFIMGLRLVVDEDRDKGLSREEGLAICRIIQESGLVDFLNIIRGHIDHNAPLANVIPMAGMALAPHLDFAGDVRAKIRLPVFHAARIADVATARHAIVEGKLDMVGMTRAHLADPHIVRKVAAGEEQSIRPCVGATYCLDRIYEGHEALCIHNPSTGREGELPHEITLSTGRKKRIVIIGAGPAGLEAARVSSMRGHEVVLLEAAGEAGGQIRLLSRLPRRRELIGIIDWRLEELKKRSVEPCYGVLAEAHDVQILSPDIVIIATGGMPRGRAIPEGGELAASSWDILAGTIKPAGNVLLFDDGGGPAGLSAAEVIVTAGTRLTIISPERQFAPEMGGLNLVPYMKLFATHAVEIVPMMRISCIEKEGNALRASLWSPYTQEGCGSRVAEQIVLDDGTAPVDDLYLSLKDLSTNRGEIDQLALIATQPQRIVRNPDGRFQLFRIGDAVASRNVHAAIYEAMRLCCVF